MKKYTIEEVKRNAAASFGYPSWKVLILDNRVPFWMKDKIITQVIEDYSNQNK